MTAGDSAARVRVLALRSIDDVADETSWFRFDAPADAMCAPGQFFMLSTPEPSTVAYLARPFSIGDVADGTWSFLVRAMGRGTAWFRSLPVGAPMRVVGPLGTPFVRHKMRVHRMIAGGVGIAPFVYLARAVRHEQPDTRIELVYGERSEGSHLCFDHETEALFDVVERYTDDATLGRSGTVVDGLADRWGDSDVAWYACGPGAMMRTVWHELERAGARCVQFSMEERMACGFGACQACVVPNRDAPPRYRLLCKEGPVVNPREVAW